jgi:hypothetical protein
MTGACAAGAEDLHWLVEPLRQQRVRLHLPPFEATFFAVDADSKSSDL